MHAKKGERVYVYYVCKAARAKAIFFRLMEIGALIKFGARRVAVVVVAAFGSLIVPAAAAFVLLLVSSSSSCLTAVVCVSTVSPSGWVQPLQLAL